MRRLRGDLRLLGESLRDAIPALVSLIRRLCALLRALWRRWHLPEREKRRSSDRCVPINEPAFHKPDPLIYCQSQLMKLGLAVTWDNPDIQLFRDGLPVPSSSLEKDTEYEIVARIWNGSVDAPVVDLPVHFTVHGFGIETGGHIIGQDKINLGVNGGPDHPAFARAKWRTPATAGHFCLRARLDWLDDANPDNNLGQENTNVGKLSSPADFRFDLHNPTQERLPYTFETDAYALPAQPPCPREPETPEARERRMRAVHDRRAHPLPDGWTVTLTPNEPVVAAGATQPIRVSVTAPAGFMGREPVNVNAFNRYGLAGGVTLYVERG